MAVAIVVAAGRGMRLGRDEPKALVPLAGRPMVGWCLQALLAVAEVRRLVVVLPPGHELPNDPAMWGIAAGGFGAVTAQAGDGPAPRAPRPPRVLAVSGGAERAHSVRAGLAALDPVPEDEPVLVQDAARPMLTPAIVGACLAAITGGVDVAVAAAPMTDTVKEATTARATGSPRSAGASLDPGVGGRALPRVVRTLDRTSLWSVQTPQVFRCEALATVLALGDDVLAAATDEASLVEAAGGDVRLVATTSANRKVTDQSDLRLAEIVLTDRGA